MMHSRDDTMKATYVNVVVSLLLMLAVQVQARPGAHGSASATSVTVTRTRYSRQDLRMLPANSTGTPQDQALAGGVVPQEVVLEAVPDSAVTSASAHASAPTPTQQPYQRPLGTTATATSSSARVPDGRRGGLVPVVATGPSVAQGQAHGQERTASRPGSAADLSGEDSNIVFPTPPVKVDLPLGQPKFDPFARAPGRVTPSCAKGSTFCTDVDNYPENYLQTMLRSASLGYKEYFGNDVIAESNITQRIDANDENPLCPYEETVVFPKMAKNKEDKWLYVVNQDRFTQGVRIETCLNQGTACQLAENFPFGYTTSCRQKYILRKLVALTQEGQTQTDMFRLPSCCSCYVTRSNLSSRIRSNMTPVVKTESNRKR